MFRLNVCMYVYVRCLQSDGYHGRWLKCGGNMLHTFVHVHNQHYGHWSCSAQWTGWLSLFNHLSQHPFNVILQSIEQDITHDHSAKGMLPIPPTFRQSVAASVTLETPNIFHTHIHAFIVLRGCTVTWKTLSYIAVWDVSNVLGEAILHNMLV